MSTLDAALKDETELEKEHAVGVAEGICAGVVAAVLLVLLGMGVLWFWRWSSAEKPPTPSTTIAPSAVVPRKPFEVPAVYTDVPFFPLSESVVRHGLANSEVRKQIEGELRNRWYIDHDLLKGPFRYRPRLRFDTDARSVTTMSIGTLKLAVIRLVNSDGSPGRYGVIPYEEYIDDIEALGL
jgi:hypothetical protein